MVHPGALAVGPGACALTERVVGPCGLAPLGAGLDVGELQGSLRPSAPDCRCRCRAVWGCGGPLLQRPFWVTESAEWGHRLQAQGGRLRRP